MTIETLLFTSLVALLKKQWDAETTMLATIRDSANGWHQELTDPVRPLLTGELPIKTPSPQQRMFLRESAEKIERAAQEINSGESLGTVIPRLEKSVGVPFITKRKSMLEKLEKFFQSGDYVKGLHYGPMSQANYTADEFRAGVIEVRTAYAEFKRNLDALVEQVNAELASLGN